MEKANLRDVQTVFEQQKLLLADLNNLDTSAAVPKSRDQAEPKRAQNKKKDGHSYQDSTKLKARRPREEEDIPKTQKDPSRLGRRYTPSPRQMKVKFEHKMANLG